MPPGDYERIDYFPEELSRRVNCGIAPPGECYKRSFRLQEIAREQQLSISYRSLATLITWIRSYMVYLLGPAYGRQTIMFILPAFVSYLGEKRCETGPKWLIAVTLE